MGGGNAALGNLSALLLPGMNGSAVVSQPTAPAPIEGEQQPMVARMLAATETFLLAIATCMAFPNHCIHAIMLAEPGE
jgi:hypothetical protein